MTPRQISLVRATVAAVKRKPPQLRQALLETSKSPLNPYSGTVPVATPRSLLAATWAWLADSWTLRIARRLVAARRERIAIEELQSWDDHRLRDIGIARMHIDAAVRGQYRPASWSAEPGAATHRCASKREAAS
jgi:uncharacterized protein YjiS (DUF1127 family)